MTRLTTLALTGLLTLAVLSLPSSSPVQAGPAESGKGADIGGPPRESARPKQKFGVQPAELPEAEKAERLEIIEKEYASLRKNQDLYTTRKRRNHVVFLGDMRYPPAAKFLSKVFENDRDVRTRVAALVAIGKTGDPETTWDATKKAISLHKKDPVLASSLPRMFAHVDDPELGKQLLERLKGDDDLVATLIECVGLTGVPEGVPVIQEILEDENDIRVQFEGLRALGRCGGPDIADDLVGKLRHDDWRIRMAAAEGLGFAGNPVVIDDLAALIRPEEEQVVIETATEALGAVGTREAIPHLLETLKHGRLRARNMARTHLVSLARSEFRQERDYHTDYPSWNSWWKKVEKGFDPDDPRYDYKETASYYRFKIHSDRVLFVLDVSGSMKWPDPPSPSRMELARKELFGALNALAKQSGREQLERSSDTEDEYLRRPPVYFNVATFAGHVEAWREEEVLATQENVDAAIEWLGTRNPRGGTNTYDALKFAVEKANVDSVFFLSDGVPSVGQYDEPETILSEIRKRNRFRRVAINTVALIVGKTPIEKALKYEDPDEMAEFMSRIAEENFGEFADESRP